MTDEIPTTDKKVVKIADRLNFSAEEVLTSSPPPLVTVAGGEGFTRGIDVRNFPKVFAFSVLFPVFPPVLFFSSKEFLCKLCKLCKGVQKAEPR